MAGTYRSMEQFRRDLARGSYGPMTSAAEEIADELYHQDFSAEFDSMWDSVDDDDD